MIRGGNIANPTFSSVNLFATDSTTASTVLYGNNSITVSPTSNSSSIIIGQGGKFTYTGTADIVGAGHCAGVLGWGVMNASGRTAGLLIGLEGKFDVIAGTVTTAVSTESQLTSNTGTIGTWIGNDSQIVNNSGPIGAAAGVRSVISANASTISIFAGLWVPDMTSITGITTKYSILSQDPAALLSHAGSIQTKTGVAVPAGGTTGAGYLMFSTANLGIFAGSGAPTLSAAQGSLYIRTDGSTTATRLYVNTNGTTGWTNFTSAA